MSIKFVTIGKDKIIEIKPLWEKLNEIHLKDSEYFKEHFLHFSFEKRCNKFNEIDSEDIRIELMIDNGKTVGYCISTIEKTTGEIDSLYIDDAYRGSGYGAGLVENSKKWFKQKNCSKVMVTVAEGHESVFDFYRKCGFFPRLTYLQLK